MKPTIHVESPDGEILKTTPATTPAAPAANEHKETNDANDNAAGPKVNPDPRANSNIDEKDKSNSDEGPGTEITDGEAG